MLRSLLLACGLLCLVSAVAVAQKQGGGGQPAPPAPSPNPKPGNQPGQPPPTPDPAPPRQQLISVRGRIIAEGVRDFPQLEVRIELEGGQPFGFAYTNSTGEFTFQGPAPYSDQAVFVIVELEGFKPYRERIGGMGDWNGLSSSLTIFLDRENIIRTDRSGGDIVNLKQLRAKIPGKAVDEYEKALKDSSKGNTTSAVERLERAVKVAPEFYEAQSSLGIQYMRLKKYDEAEAALLRAKNLSPKAPETLINLGMLYYQRGEELSDSGSPEEAAAAFQKATGTLEDSIKSSPLSPVAQSYLGAALYKTGSYERAESSLKKALELNDQQDDARLMLINVYVKEARYVEALAVIKSYDSKNPKSPQRATLDSIQGKLEKLVKQ
jgi:type IV pilus assembly protein PilF